MSGASQAVLQSARPGEARLTTSFLGPAAVAQWVKLTGNASISRQAAANWPGDFWGQADVWIPPGTFTACGEFDNSNLFDATAYFLDFGLGAIQAQRIGGVWKWVTAFGTVATTGPSASTTYTIEFHFQTISGNNRKIEWFVNGTLVATDTFASTINQKTLFLNHFPEGCCCEIYFYANVKVGTSRHGTSIFGDDFSGGLGNWTPSTVAQPWALALVTTPSAAACATLTITPPRGLPGTAITVTGSGFAPFSALTLYLLESGGPLGFILIEDFTATTDASGDFTVVTTVPHVPSTGTGDPYFVTLVDESGNLACAALAICGTTPADGITTVPDPLVAVGGLFGDGQLILDYIWHDGAHWVLWQDGSVLTGAGTFPPPANHTMNATRISADGSSVTDYPIDSGYKWVFEEGNVGFPGVSGGSCGPPRAAPVWDGKFYFTGWDKPIHDVHFASDGETLWVALLTEETEAYPWLDNLDAVGLNPGAAAQFVDLATLTSGFTSFATSAGAGYHRYNTQTTGPINFFQPHAFPVTDGGEKNSGHWSIYKVVMFSFGGGGFSRIGEIPAFYCPSQTQTSGYGYAREGSIIGGPTYLQESPRGSLVSTVAICASPTDPGRCHVVWSEGGDWGRVGLGNPADCTALVWDAGPEHRNYRVNYTTWDAVGKLTDSDIMSSNIDRTNWYFLNDYGLGGGDFNVGYTWPDQDEFGGRIDFAIRNDNPGGIPYLFMLNPQCWTNAWNPDSGVAFPPAYIDPHGHPFLDNIIIYSDTLRIYDLSSGSPVLVQQVGTDLFPTDAEGRALYTVGPPFAPPIGADMVFSPTAIDNGAGQQAVSYLGHVRSFGISLPYADPTLNGALVYLVHLPVGKRWLTESVDGSLFPNSGVFDTRIFLRVPCDMSAPFDYLDDVRQVHYSILKEPFDADTRFNFYGSDFFSDPKNIWIPSPGLAPGSIGGFGGGGYKGLWLDRVCENTWIPMMGGPPLVPYPGNPIFFPSYYTVGAECTGFHYDDAADSVSFVVSSQPDANPSPGGPLFGVITEFFCRGCRDCPCATGIHIAHRF